MFFALLALALMASPAGASTINLTVGAGGVSGDHILGEIFTRKDLDQSGGQAVVDALMINGLLAITTLGTRSGNNPEYWRSSTDFGDLPTATSVGADKKGNQTTFVLSQVYQYLVVSYDGQNGGSQAYYIGNLAVGDTINIVQNAHPDAVKKNKACGGIGEPDCGHLVAGNYYGVTHSTFLNPGVPVPDGGMTSSLLGMAIAGIGLFSHRRKK
jgi:hypothetical protein